jgi:ATP-binding cassette, subfamily C (CFTR/MRP), member 1
MISIQTALILLPIIPLGLIYYYVYRIYISTSRQLKRIDSITRSPIYEHFSETINGSTSIRAYDVCDRFINESNRRIDENHICYYPSFTASRWLAVRLEFIGYSIVFIATLFSVLYRDSITPGIAGLSIVYSLNITFVLGFFVKAATDFENNCVSIERCSEYSEIPSEVFYFHNNYNLKLSIIYICFLFK